MEIIWNYQLEEVRILNSARYIPGATNFEFLMWPDQVD